MAGQRATENAATLGDYAVGRRRQGRALMWGGAAIFVLGVGIRVLRAESAALWLSLVGLGTALIVGGRRYVEVTVCPMCGERLLGSDAPPQPGVPGACASCGASFRLKWP